MTLHLKIWFFVRSQFGHDSFSGSPPYSGLKVVSQLAIHSPIEELFPATGLKPTQFRNSSFKEAG